ncbi:FadR/GntR family transcriptional regulator [Streptomyces sp. TP-A0356]|uniref:FadR/GntR family transcriptional regulator n=1 Tax=Streptomyces sp. TP-A0356 TaxID=1359208 RepID=UPI0006E3201F|nr:FadR/GntR family transcriptional regulator [Streptomyces sp. TP-A0356]
MTLDTLRPNSLVDQATQRLRNEIAAGTWEVGTKLPGETTLARTLGVGRSTVREALRALAGAGLVQARQGAGVFVTATTPHEDWPARLRQSAITEIYEVRAMLEVEAAQLAAERRTPQDIAALDEAMQQRRRAATAGNAEFVDADIALHTAIVAAAHNPLLTGLFEEFVPSLRRGLIDLLGLTDLRSSDSNHGEEGHAALVDAVRRGDAEAAGSILRAELQQTLTRLQAV